MLSHFPSRWISSAARWIVGGIALLPFLSHSLGLDDQSFWLAALYCTLIPSMASSTPTGILRAVDRFDLIAVQQATKPFCAQRERRSPVF